MSIRFDDKIAIVTARAAAGPRICAGAGGARREGRRQRPGRRARRHRSFGRGAQGRR